MAVLKGKDFLLKDNSTGSASTVGGMRTTSMTINGEMIDVTTKDSNPFVSGGSSLGRDILDGGGVTSMSITASGVYDDTTALNRMIGFVNAGTTQAYVLTFGDGSNYSGNFKITSFEKSGDYNTEATYSLTIESSGQVTFTSA
ncbi:phage tail tube protein [Hyphomonas sp.]|jgi:TP901-1 family phage major tail protein|uniref:phage tail tube protein n=1 Tax=Hyphomonas sp. TaxID=87 RepID=UPI000C9162A4|nr:phage tail tube protein [Hyphomonas sp.]MAL42893.1 phage tail protein [Hyphomonas sp.]|tara:strand:- start:73 stop:501 length:429 start_codon:yes stop_codon:yes gene_type:complete